MIHIIITSFNEPKSTLEAVNKILEQDIKEDYKVIVADPFLEVGEFLEKNIKSKNFEFFLDPGEGKPYTMNLLFEELPKNKDDIMIFTDGDVYLEPNSINEIIDAFKDPKVGCVTGKPISMNPRSQKYGYWSKLLYSGVDKVRKKLDQEEQFFQCSGYLFAIRNGLIEGTDPDVPEDCIIPYFTWKKGYKIGYADKAGVKVKYPDNWKDWLNQRTRTIKAHENLSKLYPDMPRTKSFWKEIKYGLLHSLLYPRSLKELFWTLQLYYARLYIYFLSYKEKNKKAFDPGWRETEIKSTSPLD